jgi:hypothetical protein
MLKLFFYGREDRCKGGKVSETSPLCFSLSLWLQSRVFIFIFILPSLSLFSSRYLSLSLSFVCVLSFLSFTRKRRRVALQWIGTIERDKDREKNEG